MASDVRDEASGVLKPKAIPSPSEPTAREIETHNLSHMPYRSWCPFCVAGRRNNSGHKAVKHERKIPLVVADYAAVRNRRDQDLLTVLVVRLFPQRVTFACVVDVKGPSDYTVNRLAKWLKDCGLTTFAVRSDQEPAIRKMLEAAALSTERTVVEDTESETQKGAVVAPLENSAPGESASNGLAERAVQDVEDLVRTYKLALESRIGATIPSTHPICHWLIEHASNMITKLHVGDDGQTGYSRLHGKDTSERLVEFGERVMFFIPKKSRAKLDMRWRYGVWIGRSMSSDESFVATADGSVTKARAVVRLVEAARWNKPMIEAIRGTPMDMKSGPALEKIDAEPHPHLGLDDALEEAQPKQRMRMRITIQDLQKYGHTDGCPRCEMHKAGKTSGVNHSEACRKRIYDAMEAAGDQKLTKAKRLHRDEDLREMENARPMNPRLMIT